RRLAIALGRIMHLAQIPAVFAERIESQCISYAVGRRLRVARKELQPRQVYERMRIAGIKLDCSIQVEAGPVGLSVVEGGDSERHMGAAVLVIQLHRTRRSFLEGSEVPLRVN